MKQFTIRAQEYESMLLKVRSLENENSRLKGYIEGFEKHLASPPMSDQEQYDQGFHDGANKTAIELSKDFEPKDSDNFKEWLKRNNITRDSNKRYSWNDMNYVREFFFDKFIEDQRREN
jgi:hypothetical protein